MGNEMFINYFKKSGKSRAATESKLSKLLRTYFHTDKNNLT